MVSMDQVKGFGALIGAGGVDGRYQKIPVRSRGCGAVHASFFGGGMPLLPYRIYVLRKHYLQLETEKFEESQCFRFPLCRSVGIR